METIQRWLKPCSRILDLDIKKGAVEIDVSKVEEDLTPDLIYPIKNHASKNQETLKNTMRLISVICLITFFAALIVAEPGGSKKNPGGTKKTGGTNGSQTSGTSGHAATCTREFHPDDDSSDTCKQFTSFRYNWYQSNLELTFLYPDFMNSM